jgi:hypothetical protein
MDLHLHVGMQVCIVELPIGKHTRKLVPDTTPIDGDIWARIPAKRLAAKEKAWISGTPFNQVWIDRKRHLRLP